MTTPAGAKPPAAVRPDPNMAREAIPAAYKWKLGQLFKDDKAFESALAEAPAVRAKLQAYKGRLAQPRVLLEGLRAYFAARLDANKLTLYAHLRYDTHQLDERVAGMNDRALASYKAFMAETGFIRRELLAMDDAALEAAYKQVKGLGEYRIYLADVRRRKSRLLGDEAERVLALAGDNLWAEIDLNELPSDHEKTYEAARQSLALPTIKDEAGKAVQLTLAGLRKYRASKVRAVRKAAMEGAFGAMERLQNVFAGTLAGQARLDVFFARARGYKTALDAYLDKENVDPAVYQNLIHTIRANLAPLHRYVALRKRLLKVDKLRVHDLYVSMIPTPDAVFPYKEARALLPKALAPLGKTYVDMVRYGLDPKNGWVDAFPHKGKQSGAFSASVFGLHPYVKVNYQGSFDDLSTLAHEIGHALHSHLAMGKQPVQTAGYASFVAEIASTANEALLSDYVLAHANTKSERLAILGNFLEAIRTTIYRQALFAEFELAVHTRAEQDKPITAGWLRETYHQLTATYYGPDFEIGPLDDMEWAYIPHFYFKYYVYTYATGLAAGIALADRMRHGGQAARDAYIEMLSGGSSKPPLELLKGAGVDMTRPETIAASARRMDETITEIERLLAE